MARIEILLPDDILEAIKEILLNLDRKIQRRLGAIEMKLGSMNKKFNALLPLLDAFWIFIRK